MADEKQNGSTPNSTLELRIPWDQLTGAINVTGPIKNKVVALGMMGAAAEAINKYHEAEAKNVVLAPNLGLRM